MFHITDSLQFLTEAERIVGSHRLKDDEKIVLLEALHEKVDINLPGVPRHATAVRDALARMIENERRDAPGTVGKPRGPQTKARKAKGSQEPPEVDAGGTEEGSEAPEGEAEGLDDQA